VTELIHCTLQVLKVLQHVGQTAEKRGLRLPMEKRT
jgi:hypothetical protein